MSAKFDWDAAYSNGAYIPGGNDFPPRWKAQAAAFREEMTSAGRLKADISYGPHNRNVLDLSCRAAKRRAWLCSSTAATG